MVQALDMDDHSCIAVMVYCSRILETVHWHPLARLIVDGLVSPDQIPGDRSSSVGYGIVPHGQQWTSRGNADDLFNLIRVSLQDCAAERTSTALRLLNILLSVRHSATLPLLMTTKAAEGLARPKALRTLISQIETLLTLAGNALSSENLDSAYDVCLKDALVMIESHDCSASVLGFDSNHNRSEDTDSEDGHENGDIHFISTQDALFLSLTTLLRSFFTNDVEVNVELTAVFAHLVSCPRLQLAGLLTRRNTVQDSARSPDLELHNPDPIDDLLAVLDTEEQIRIERFKKQVFSAMKISERNDSIIFDILHQLQKQLNTVKAQIPNFDMLTASRRRAFEGDAVAHEQKLEQTPRLSQATPIPRQATSGYSTPPLNTLPRSAKGLAEPITPQKNRSVSAISTGLMTPTSSAKQQSSPIWWWFTGSPASQANRDAASETPSNKKKTPSLSSLTSTGNKVPAAQDIMQQVVDVTEGNDDSEDAKTVRQTSVTNLLTNAVILQEFMLELAALMQVRAGLLEDEFSIL